MPDARHDEPMVVQNGCRLWIVYRDRLPLIWVVEKIYEACRAVYDLARIYRIDHSLTRHRANETLCVAYDRELRGSDCQYLSERELYVLLTVSALLLGYELTLSRGSTALW